LIQDDELNALKMYMRGIRAQVPMWVLMMDAAGHDPLRAQEIENGVSEIWWARWLAWRKAYGDEEERRRRDRK